jgi:hypothetical protein
MKIKEGKGDREIQGKQLCRQREKGRIRRRIVNVITARRRDTWQRTVGQKEEEWREKDQKGGSVTTSSNVMTEPWTRVRY